MRRIIAYLATSADGFIARKDGDVGWLDRPQPPGGYGMAAFLKSVDTVVFGRKTWDVGRRLGQPSVPGKANYVFTRRPPRQRPDGIQFVQGDVAAFATELRRQKGKDVWLMGGAELFAAFLDAGQLDALVLHVVPVLIGEGIPLLSPARREVPLALVGTRRYSDGLVRLEYSLSPKLAARRRRRAPPRPARGPLG